MGKHRALTAFLMVLVLGAVMVIGTQFFILTMGATDTGVNLTGTGYQEQYNTSTDIVTGTMAITKFAPPLLGALALFFVLMSFKVIKFR